MLLHNCAYAGVRDRLALLLPYHMQALELGFKYLGYHLKPNNYRIAEWNWLIQKVDWRINNWTFRWLSLGGRLTLAKSVLEGIPVYWFSLGMIPSSIINTIRKRILHFLWAGNS